MKRTIIFFVVAIALLVLPACSRRIQVIQPEGAKVVVDDRPLSVWSSEDESALVAFSQAIARLPEAQQKDAIIQFLRVYESSVAARERVALAAIQREKESGVNWLDALKQVIALGGLVGTAVK